MPTQILLYGNITDESATKFVTDLEAASDDTIKVRVNTNGGEVNSCWAMVSKFSEHDNTKEVAVDGKAFSSGFLFCLYADSVSCKDFSEFLFHRAGYPEWIEKNPDYFTEELKIPLASMNAKIKQAFDAKIDTVALQAVMDKKPELNGAKVKDLFSMDGRIDLRLSATEAKKIGLVNKITTVTPQRRAELDLKYAEAIALYGGLPTTATIEKPKTDTTMDLLTLKNSHPSVYAEVFALGQAAGVKEEKTRVASWTPFMAIDSKTALEGIKGSEPVTAADISEFTVKSLSANKLAEIEGDNVDASKVKTPEATATQASEKQKKLDEFVAAAKANIPSIS